MPRGEQALYIQYGALPYRFTPDGELELLLITTRRSKRWVIPKGWPIKGLTPLRSAAREAHEEAGVSGPIEEKSIGAFVYSKLLDGCGIQVSCEVRVFALSVEIQSETWPEINQRLVEWVTPGEALIRVVEPELRALIAAFAKKHSRSEQEANAFFEIAGQS